MPFSKSFHHTISSLLTGCSILSTVIRFTFIQSYASLQLFQKNEGNFPNVLHSVMRFPETVAAAWDPEALPAPLPPMWGAPPVAASTGDRPWLTAGQPGLPSPGFHPHCPNQEGRGRGAGREKTTSPSRRGCRPLGTGQTLSMRSCHTRFLSKKETRKLVCR